MTDEEIRTARAVLGVLGAEDTETNAEQMAVYLEAFEIFVERQSDYRDLWKASGSANNLMQAKSKVARMEVATAEKVRVDSGIDLINYGAFFVRNVRDGN
jgi:hypothetical protein